MKRIERNVRLGTVTNRGIIVKRTSQTVHVISGEKALNKRTVWYWNKFPEPGGYYWKGEWLNY